MMPVFKMGLFIPTLPSTLYKAASSLVFGNVGNCYRNVRTLRAPLVQSCRRRVEKVATGLLKGLEHKVNSPVKRSHGRDPNGGILIIPHARGSSGESISC